MQVCNVSELRDQQPMRLGAGSSWEQRVSFSPAIFNFKIIKAMFDVKFSRVINFEEERNGAAKSL